MAQLTAAHNTCPACEIGEFARNYYFNGKLLVDRDFTDEQRYYVDKLRHHNQALHGWGVVCGLKVKQHPNETCQNRYVVVESGSAVDCCGHDILVPEETYVDITALDAIKELKGDGAHALQICLRYKECPTEEVPVLYDECGCDETKCAPNRILESYEVGVMIVPPEQPDSLHTPKFSWENSITVAHAAAAVVHDASHRLYVLTADDPATVYQISTDNHATITSRTLPAKVLAQAVSNDGKHLYVVVEPTAPAMLRQLHVLDTSQTGMPDFNTAPLDLPNSSGSAVALAVAPNARLLALVASSGVVLRWPVDLDTNPAPAAPDIVKNLGAGVAGLALSSDGKLAFVLGPGNQIKALDLAAATVTPITVLPAAAKPSSIALVSSTAPDLLAVADQTNMFLHLVQLPPSATLIGSVKLDHPPVNLVASAGGHWAYLLERDTDSFIQSVSLDALLHHPAVTPGAAFKIGDDSRQIVMTASGKRLYIPYVANIAHPAAGGVAIVEVTEGSCAEILWRHLDGCPHCDLPNCVVLATITDYHVGGKVLDVAIDNRKGRRVLASTEILQELIECLREHGTDGKPGKDGTDGKDGQDGRDGEGLESSLTRIVDLSWKHNSHGEKIHGSFPFTGFVPIARRPGSVFDRESLSPYGLVIIFSKQVKVYDPNPTNPRSRLLIDAENVLQVKMVDFLWNILSSSFLSNPQLKPASGLFVAPLATIAGTVIPVEWTTVGDKIDWTSFKESGETYKNTKILISKGIAMLPIISFGTYIQMLEQLKLRSPAFEFPEKVWIKLRGDLVKDIDDRAVDAEFVRGDVPTGDRPKDGEYGIQGGIFESWFWLNA